LEYLFCLSYPTYWELSLELGERYLSMGAAASALQIFEEFEAWEKIIDCYRLLGKLKKAEEIIRARLEVKPTPLLWCVLGDVINDDKCYENAWELSEKRFARAQRGLAISALKKQNVRLKKLI
jgi:tetratricopeptide (TPR) repeat protein